MAHIVQHIAWASLFWENFGDTRPLWIKKNGYGSVQNRGEKFGGIFVQNRGEKFGGLLPKP